MALVPIFTGTVSDDGKLELNEQESRQRKRWLLSLKGKPVDVVVRVHRSKASDRQKRWHWGVALPLIAAELGYRKDEHEEVHYWLLVRCFGVHRNEKLGIEIPNKPHMSDLNTAEMSEFMEWEVQFAAMELGINIPLPGEAEFR